MDPITMMVASIGMQFFNNYANSDKNKEIQDKQREFQKAAAEHDFERMRKLQAESAKLALELEAEVHKERAEDINSNYDALLENFAHSFAIQNWPLNVLPFVMKGESFGSLFKGTIKSVNMHCIFTPSNCDWFNRMFYDDIDLRLEAEMNNNWNAQTTHPIVYYGGGWNRRTVLPHGISIPNLIDLDDIGLLETNLKNVPVMVVTPYFDPWLHFRVKIWGMGKDSEVPFRIDIPHGADIEFSKRIFSYDYNKAMKEEMTEDFINTTIEEFVPYMESLIGFVADKYFWEVYGTAPQLASIGSNEIILLSDSFKKIYTKDCLIINKKSLIHRNSAELIDAIDNCLLFCSDDNQKLNYISNIFDLIVEVRLGSNSKKQLEHTNVESVKTFKYNDICVLKKMLDIVSNINKSNILTSKISTLINEVLINSKNIIDSSFSYISLYDFINNISLHLKSQEEDTLFIEIDKKFHTVSSYFESSKLDFCGYAFYCRYTIQTSGFLVPKEIKERKQPKFRISKKNIANLLDKLSLEDNVNYFDIIMSIEKIKKYCERLIDDVKECSLSIKEDIPAHLIKDKSIIDHLLYVRVTSESNQVVERMEYYDKFEKELYNYFLLSNTLILQ